LGRAVAAVVAPDAWYLKGGLSAAALEEALTGRSFVAARRIGKVLLLDVAGGPTLGLRFGMTGRLLVDGSAGVEELVYASVRDEVAWDRLRLDFVDGGELRVRDPRRLGGVFVDPDESRLGVDALAVTRSGLARVLAASTAPLKARLMDQARLAGVGNLAADEILFRAGLDPARPAASLTPAELRRLHRHVVQTLDDLIAGGGSHTGTLQPSRMAGGSCPRDGAPLVRRTIGGRTTWSCPRHQV
ncbi:MAG: formamidopyrimidine-DNA glycosylase, partial [Actinomycetota bacterium]|nr:formamidopyrimidine-DNA glycosylase [Actinomycetota bacterium]